MALRSTGSKRTKDFLGDEVEFHSRAGFCPEFSSAKKVFRCADDWNSFQKVA